MKAVFLQNARVFKDKWVYVAALLTAVLLWADLGADASFLLYGSDIDTTGLITKAFTGKGNILSLPLLAALPFAANSYTEMRSGFTRLSIFRCGKKSYFLYKAIALVCATVFSQMLGIMVFCVIVGVLSQSFCFVSVSMLLQRLLTACIFALIGNVGAIVTKDTVSAYVLPVVTGFSLSMLRTRFFLDVIYLDPTNWLSPESGMLPFLILLFIGMILISTSVTMHGVKRYV